MDSHCPADTRVSISDVFALEEFGRSSFFPNFFTRRDVTSYVAVSRPLCVAFTWPHLSATLAVNETICLFKQGEFNKALELCDHSFEEDSDQFQGCYWHAKVLAALGERGRAISIAKALRAPREYGPPWANPDFAAGQQLYAEIKAMPNGRGDFPFRGRTPVDTLECSVHPVNMDEFSDDEEDDAGEYTFERYLERGQVTEPTGLLAADVNGASVRHLTIDSGESSIMAFGGVARHFPEVEDFTYRTEDYIRVAYDFRGLAQWPNLKTLHLHLSGQAQIAEGRFGLEVLAPLVNLESFHVRVVRFGLAKDLKVVEGFPKLRDFAFGGYNVDTGDVLDLSRLTHLRTLLFCGLQFCSAKQNSLNQSGLMALKVAGNATLIMVDSCVTNTLRAELSTSMRVLEFKYDKHNVGTHPAVAELAAFLGQVQYLRLKTSAELSATSAQFLRLLGHPSESEPEAASNQGVGKGGLKRSSLVECDVVSGDAAQDAHVPADLQLHSSRPIRRLPPLQDLVEEPTRALPQGAARVLHAPGMIDDFYSHPVDWSARNVVAVALSESVFMFHEPSGRTERLLSLPRGIIPTALRWTGEGLHLGVGTSAGEVQIWDCHAQKHVRNMQGHAGRISALAWHGRVLSSGAADAAIHHHDVRIRDHLVCRLSGAHTGTICGLDYSSDGVLASGGNNNAVCIWESPSARSPVHELTGHRAAVKAIRWCPWQRRVLATGGGTADRQVCLWNASSGRLVASADAESQVTGVVWLQQERELLTAHGYSQERELLTAQERELLTERNQLSIWKLPSLAKVGDLEGHSGRILGLAQSPDGSLVCSSSADNTLRFWRMFSPRSDGSASATVDVKRRRLHGKQPAPFGYAGA